MENNVPKTFSTQINFIDYKRHKKKTKREIFSFFLMVLTTIEKTLTAYYIKNSGLLIAEFMAEAL